MLNTNEAFHFCDANQNYNMQLMLREKATPMTKVQIEMEK